MFYTAPPHASIPLESIIPTGWGPDFEEQDRQKEDMDIDMDWDEFTDAMTIDWDFFIDEMDLDDLPAPSDNDCMVLDLNDFLEEYCINAITRSGRQYQGPVPDSPLPPPIEKIKLDPTPEEDLILKQLKKTQANISIWSLIQSSYHHRQALSKAHNQCQVPSDTSPETLVATLMNATKTAAITFTDKDLPEGGSYHFKALYITVMACGKPYKVSPMVLIDNGSALNVCPLKVASCLRLEASDFTPSDRAYENTKREVLGVATLDVSIGPHDRESMKIPFQVILVPPLYSIQFHRACMF